MRFFLRTYGCQMNERDSDAAAALLIAHGLAPASGEEGADLILVNTCSVRGKAEDKALGKLGLLAARKREQPGLIVGAIGCMVQHFGADLFRRVPGLDLAVGPGALPRLPRLLEQVIEGGGPALDTGDEPSGPATGHVGRLQEFVTILLGCDRHCAYCIVPRVRGPERSRPAVEVLDEVRRLSAAGTREITLLGQSVMAYGQRQPVWPSDAVSPGGYAEALPRLLEAVSAVPGIARVRFTSGHPSGCTEELARAMRDLGPVCAHLHLPLQSGSDRILERMGRGYTADGYRAAVARLRAHVPDIALTTDIIVGFPTESEADFDATRRLMDEIGFDNAFIFKYSPRDNTRAAAWTDDVTDDEKRRRNRILLEDQEVRGLERNRRRVGAEVEVLVEGVSLRNEAMWSGRTRGNTVAVFAHRDGVRAGDLVRVAVKRAMPQTLYGDIVDASARKGQTG